MKFFEDYDVDIEQYEASEGYSIPDGLYDFEITEALVRKGTTKDPDAVNINVKYRLENAEGAVFNFTDWFKIPSDPNHPTRQEEIAMSNFKKLLISAKVEDLQNAGPDDLEGLTGTLRLVTSENRNTGRKYQDPRDVKFDDAEAPAPVAAKTATKPAATKANPFAAKK